MLTVDDEDNTLDKYKKKFKKQVLVFSKEKVAKYIDSADLSKDRRVIVYARNAAFDFAEKLGLEYFVELDDDYISFEYRYIENHKLKTKNVNELDDIFDIYLDFLDDSKALTVAFLQGGDLVGGAETFPKAMWKRKAMNSFFCKTKNRFFFNGRLNEDVNTYLTYGAVGKLICSFGPVMLQQMPTQANQGGMSDTYLDGGTYQKSFTSVLFAPSCVKVGLMPSSHTRVHHNISWNNAVPKIISDRYKKK